MKTLFSLLFICASALSFAQTVKFDEIAFNVSANDFAKSLQAAGFEQNGNNLYGNIEPYGKCSISLSQPNAALIELSECYNWQDLLGLYTELKNIFGSKYLQSSVDESFTSAEQPKTDDEKFWETKFGRCHYKTMYSTQNNYITVCINAKPDFSCSVAVLLMDNAIIEEKYTEMEHLEFMGIPIDGTLESFVEKLERKGLKKGTVLDASYMMEGDFAGYPNCYIHIFSSKQGDYVYAVGVSIAGSTWKTLSANYFHLKNMLAQKYGVPNQSVETFETMYQPTNDNERMYYLQLNKCNYETAFILSNGSISVKIMSVPGETFIMLMYMDARNNHHNQSNILDDL